MKANARLLVCALAAILCCGGVQAQNKKIYLASSSSRYPNERPIWSEKQAQEWFDKHSPIKGINHPEPPCDAVSQDEALQRAAQIGYNSVRWWPNSWDYINSVDNYATMPQSMALTALLSSVLPTFLRVPAILPAWKRKSGKLYVISVATNVLSCGIYGTNR